LASPLCPFRTSRGAKRSSSAPRFPSGEAGGYVFRYLATVKTFIAGATGEDQPFEEKTVEGVIARSWI
jgi:hypothetical protein